MASEASTFESDGDVELIGDALPFSLKLVETLIAESPEHPGLLVAASRGFTLYAYAYVDAEAERAAYDDLERAQVLRKRARKLYLRAHGYAMRALELSDPGFGEALFLDPAHTGERIGARYGARDVPLLYWAAASLGLAISSSRADTSMLARLPEVDALLQSSLALDEAWNQGALHEFAVTWEASKPGTVDPDRLAAHYHRALELSAGRRASVFVAFAEASAVPAQNRERFGRLIDRALAVDLDAEPSYRLLNSLAQRRARWLRARTDVLFLE